MRIARRSNSPFPIKIWIKFETKKYTFTYIKYAITRVQNTNIRSKTAKSGTKSIPKRLYPFCSENMMVTPLANCTDKLVFL